MHSHVQYREGKKDKPPRNGLTPFPPSHPSPTPSYAETAALLNRFVFCATTSLPSQKRGSSLPGTKCLSTLSLVITHIRIHPPDDPSRAIASASAKRCVSKEGPQGRLNDEESLTVLYKLNRLLLVPSFAVCSIAVTIHIGRSGTYRVSGLVSSLRLSPSLTANSPGLLEDTASKGDVEDPPAFLVPAGDDDTRAQLVLVLITQLLEQRRDRGDGGRVTIDGSVHLTVLVDSVRDRLRVGRRA
jgi:hypothetical protein